MDVPRAEKIYSRLAQKGDAVDAAIKSRGLQQLSAYPDDLGDAICLFFNELAPWITGNNQTERMIKVNSLAKSIYSESAANNTHPAQYTGWLVLWNTWFRRTHLKLQNPPVLAAKALEIAKEIEAGGWDDDAGFKAYCEHAPEADKLLFNMRKTFEDMGVPKTNLYATMHFLQQNSLSVEKLNVGTARDIYYLSLKAPPLTKFEGFDDWGPGNHGSVEDNKMNHFLKHVLDAHPEGDKQKLPWQDECGVWWEKLQIKLTRKQAADNMLPTMFNLVKVHFPAEDDGALPYHKVGTVVGIVKNNGGWPAALKAMLVDGYADLYIKTAVALSKTMTNVIVHTDKAGTLVQVKGVNGSFYIGGRMEGVDLGISTCFVPKPDVDKVTVNVDKQIWQVSPP